MAYEKPEIMGAQGTPDISRNFHDHLKTICDHTKDISSIFRTERQRAWVAAYWTLKAADMFKRPWASVAAVLGITDSASLRLMKRVEATLSKKKDFTREAIRGELQEEIDDDKIDQRYTKLERTLAGAPETLEKIRGISGITHWRPAEVFVEQTGRSYMIGPGGETITDEEAKSLGLTVKIRSRHDPEPGHKWWNYRIVKECERSGKPYAAVYQEFMSEAYARWPE